MEYICNVFIAGGIITIVCGIIQFVFPELKWNLSYWSRWHYVEGGELSDFYYKKQRGGGICAIVLGVVVIIAAIGMKFMPKNLYFVYVDDIKLNLPCNYSKIVELGYELDEDDASLILGAANSWGTQQYSCIARNAEGKEVEIYFENRTVDDKLIKECEVVGIASEIETGPTLQLLDEIQIGMSEREAKEINSSGSYWRSNKMEYSDSIFFEWYRITINFEDDIVSGIEVIHKYSE